MFASWLKTNKVHALDFSKKALPTAKDRDFWESISAEDKNVYMEEAEYYLGYEFPIIKATDFMEYYRSGCRSIMEDKHFPRRQALCALAIGECIEHKGRFLDELVNVIFMICEETYWGLSAHIRGQKKIPSEVDPYIDLFASETAADLAIVRHMLYDELNEHVPEIIERLDRELKARIVEPYFADCDLWWLGHTAKRLENWTPWIISNVLRVLSYFEKDSRTVKSGVLLSINALQLFINDYPADGGCDEGPSYWGVSCAALFDCIDILYEMSDGKMNFFDHPLLRSMLDYIEKVYINDTYYVNFADCGARPAMIASPTTYRFAKAVGNENVARLAAKQFRAGLVSRKIEMIARLERIVKGLMCGADMMKESEDISLSTEFVLDKTEILTARENSKGTGFYLAAKGGNNGENHNHNDVGSFVIYYDGQPVMIDVGSGDYTRQVFTTERYNQFFTRSDWHNIPTVNGICQHQNEKTEKYSSSKFVCDVKNERITLEMGLENTYQKESGLSKFDRNIIFDRSAKASITVSDKFEFTNSENEITENIILIKKPDINGNEIYIFSEKGKKLKLTFDADVIETNLVSMSTEGSRNLTHSWGEGAVIWKLEIKLKCGNTTEIKFRIEE